MWEQVNHVVYESQLFNISRPAYCSRHSHTSVTEQILADYIERQNSGTAVYVVVWSTGHIHLGTVFVDMKVSSTIPEGRLIYLVKSTKPQSPWLKLEMRHTQVPIQATLSCEKLAVDLQRINLYSSATKVIVGKSSKFGKIAGKDKYILNRRMVCNESAKQ